MLLVEFPKVVCWGHSCSMCTLMIWLKIATYVEYAVVFFCMLMILNCLIMIIWNCKIVLIM